MAVGKVVDPAAGLLEGALGGDSVGVSLGVSLEVSLGEWLGEAEVSADCKGTEWHVGNGIILQGNR